MILKEVNIYKKFGVPPQVITIIFILLIGLSFAPYVHDVDFGILHVPILPVRLEKFLMWATPFLVIFFFVSFIPFFKADASKIKTADREQPDSIHVKSKYLLQSIPDIVLNELQKRNVNTDGIEIVQGFNIHDLKKRIKILNSELSSERITELVDSARDVAFTSKYSVPREDEKLANISELKVEGIQEWHIYLQKFLSGLGIPEVKNIAVLDVGIGNAYASQVFLSKCANLTGIDISQGAINYAKDKLLNANVQTGSAETLKDIDSFSIDLYLSLRTYQSTLFYIKESLHEAYRVLAKGGGIVISIPIMYLKKDDAGNIVSVLKGLIPKDSIVPSFEYAMQVSEKIEEYMHILGFKNVHIYKDSPFEIYIGSRK